MFNELHVLHILKKIYVSYIVKLFNQWYSVSTEIVKRPDFVLRLDTKLWPNLLLSCGQGIPSQEKKEHMKIC